MTRLLLASLVLAGCKSEPPERLMDTGWFTTDAASDTGGDCPDRVESITPSGGETAWYWQDGPVAFVSSLNPEFYSVTLTDADGYSIGLTPTWPDPESGSLQVPFALERPLSPNMAHELVVEDCQGRRTISFETSSLGEPLEVPVSSLAGKTWVLDLSTATWTEPGGVGALIALYFSDPILFGVTYADDDQLQVLAALGYYDGDTVRQSYGDSTFGFDPVAFDTAPYLSAQTESVTFRVGDISIPVSDFSMSLTFEKDGSRVAGGRISGIGDTREAGPLLPTPSNDPLAFCTFAGGLGVQCVPCPSDPSGPATCLFLAAEDVAGPLEDGLTLIPQ